MATSPPYNALGQAIWRYYQKRAMLAVAGAMNHGHLPSPMGLPCHYCGQPAEIYEHRDYHQPLAVHAACQVCNQALPPANVDAALVIRDINGTHMGSTTGAKLGAIRTVKKSASSANNGRLGGPNLHRRYCAPCNQIVRGMQCATCGTRTTRPIKQTDEREE